jgi:alkylated DNA repair dioxygenase AlkB
MMISTRSTLALQSTLFGSSEPALDPGLGGLVRISLTGGAWVDHLPGWVAGHETLLEILWRTTAWHHHRRRMYDNVVDVPRLVATLPEDGPGHAIIPQIATILSDRYARPVDRVSLACYRDGHDSVAWHGDRLGRSAGNAIVAIVSVGAPRRFLMKTAAGGASRAFDLGWGDLLVMGGTCQRTWQHTVPKVASAGPRISIQFRSADESEPPESDPGPRPWPRARPPAPPHSPARWRSP